MYQIHNLFDNQNINKTMSKGAFSVAEYRKDLSVTYESAQREYYASEMNIRLRQLICDLSISDVIIQAGAMQWMVGDVNATTGIKGVGDFISKNLRGAVTKESAIKPEYTGKGKLFLEPTYKHIILIDTDMWNDYIVLEDGYFLACESNLNHKLVTRNTLSSAALGNEGLFNLGLHGKGIVALESPIAYEELVEVELVDDVLKIDGSFAICRSGSLKFTVERAGKSLIGSAASGEGLVNVYRGSGRVLMAPVSLI